MGQPWATTKKTLVATLRIIRENFIGCGLESQRSIFSLVSGHSRPRLRPFRVRGEARKHGFSFFADKAGRITVFLGSKTETLSPNEWVKAFFENVGRRRDSLNRTSCKKEAPRRRVTTQKCKNLGPSDRRRRRRTSWLGPREWGQKSRRACDELISALTSQNEAKERRLPPLYLPRRRTLMGVRFGRWIMHEIRPALIPQFHQRRDEVVPALGWDQMFV